MELQNFDYLDNSFTSASFNDELDALMSLGYSLSEARKALTELDLNLQDSGERVKAALKKLGQKNNK